MSFILKALKKLEDEKAARQVQPHDINNAILTADRASSKTSRTPLKAGLIFLALVAGSGTAYVLLRQKPVPLPPAQSSIPGEASREDRAIRPQPPAPGQPMPPAATETKVAAERAADVHPAHPLAVEKAPDPEAAAPSRGSMEATAPRTQLTVQEPSGSLPSGLKVNGIAVQDDPSASVAVINGMLVRRGMTVQGMRVEEIFQDRVRFSRNGETYEVQISR